MASPSQGHLNHQSHYPLHRPPCRVWSGQPRSGPNPTKWAMLDLITAPRCCQNQEVNSGQTFQRWGSQLGLLLSMGP